MSTPRTCAALRIRLAGIVQGVGFRPFVWRLARELGLAGWVRNDSAGVLILAEGEADRLSVLVARLQSEAPPLARIDTVRTEAVPVTCPAGFVISASEAGPATTAIGPDVAVCPECLAEMCNPADRRWRHAFITCTHCGPRYTVTRQLPYDRPQTTLAPFPLCPDCRAEYTAPANRRFHAETTCCPGCGPRLLFTDADGHALAGDAIAQTVAALNRGDIVAIKGQGGFHLACDARNSDAVHRLRARKDRECKPFAVMAGNVQSVAGWAHLDERDRRQLESPERPVVVVPVVRALPGIAPGLDSMGLMLPGSPIQHLLFHEAAGRVQGTAWLARPQALCLVMTSANPGGEPIVRDNAEAAARLTGIADAFLLHDLDIAARCDDSVVCTVAGSTSFIRRSRGHAPRSLRLPASGPVVLAFGAYLKNTICVTRGDEAYLSPHVGDLDNAATCRFLEETVERQLELLAVEPVVIAHDLHPDSFATQAAIRFAAQRDIPAIGVQHHHAHIVATCAEHGVAEPVLGLALDGIGTGTDGAAWGGELLRVSGAGFERLGHLCPLPMPGADRAAREPWRMAAAVLHACGEGQAIPARLPFPAAATVAAMLARGVNCPPTSSMGRVFDAAAALLGLCQIQQYEAQAAMCLEQAAAAHIARNGQPAPAAAAWRVTEAGQLDLLPLLAMLMAARDAGHAAALFHVTLAAALADWLAWAAARTGLRTVAWGGGCFLNSLLVTCLRQNLEQQGIRVHAPHLAPPGDGGIALGQAWVAMQSLGV